MMGTVESWQTARFVAMGADFGVRTNDKGLCRELDRILAPLAREGQPRRLLSVMRDDAGQFNVVSEQTAATRIEAADILGLILNRLNLWVIADTRDRVLVHAAGAELKGVGLIIPGAMERGKTTLVAALVREGWRYLSDEAIGIAPGSLMLEAYHKPLSIDPGSWEVLADLRPTVGCILHQRQWQVPVTELGQGRLASSTVAGVIVLPTYRPGAPTRLTRVSGARTLADLLQATFRNDLSTKDVIGTLAGVSRHCTGYCLDIGDLPSAVALLQEAVGQRLRDPCHPRNSRQQC